MKKIALVVTLLLSALAWAGTPNPANYTINVHVSSSRLTERNLLKLEVIIDGKNYELQGDRSTSAVLAPGDYKATLVRDEHRTAYDSLQIYEFLFPDQKTRRYFLVGIRE